MTGDPAAVLAAALLLEGAGNTTHTACSAMRGLHVETWTGLAATAYSTHRSGVISTVEDQATDLVSASTILTRYAGELQRGNERIARSREQMVHAWERLRTDPLDLSVYRHLFVSQRDLASAKDVLARQGDLAADELYALVSGDASDLFAFTWPPDGWPKTGSLQTVDLSRTILEDSAFDPLGVAQGSIGDCYLLASVMALMQTDQGDQILRDNMRWDDERQGYWVTFFADGKPVTYFVDKGQTSGATEDGGAGVVSVYEAALREHLSFADLDDGGNPAELLELLTGTQTREYDNPPLGGWSWDEMRNDLSTGDQLVGSTRESDEEDGLWSVEMTRRDEFGHLVTVNKDVVGGHAYTVVRIEDDGSVWLLNPWGPENTADDGGEFRVSAEDFDTIFHTVASTGDGSRD